MSIALRLRRVCRGPLRLMTATMFAAVTTTAVISGGDVMTQPTSGSAAQPVAVTAAARATGLYPGAKRPMPVTLRNRSTRTLTIESIVVRVQSDPRRPGCAAAQLLRTSALTRPVRLRAGRVATIELAITMARSAPDACQGGSFLLATTVQTA